jgi:hypothetical protein
LELHFYALFLVIEARLAPVLIVEHTEIIVRQLPGACSGDLLSFSPEMTGREYLTRLLGCRRAYYGRRQQKNGNNNVENFCVDCMAGGAHRDGRLPGTDGIGRCKHDGGCGAC